MDLARSMGDAMNNRDLHGELIPIPTPHGSVAVFVSWLGSIDQRLEQIESNMAVVKYAIREHSGDITELKAKLG